MMNRARLSASTLLATTVAFLSLSVPAVAGSVQAGDAVMARVDGHDITLRDLDYIEQEITTNLSKLPPVAQRRLLVEYLIDNHLFAKEAENQKLDNDPEFESRMAYFRSRALREAYFDKAIRSAIGEKLARTLYDERAKTMQGKTEVRARHILVRTQEEAVQILEQLSTGADFEVLAQAISIDSKTKDRGGDLGFFGRGRMVKELEKAAFELEPGQVKGPVKSDFGWHIVKLEEKREEPVPKFEEVRDEIMSSLMKQKAQSVGEDLRRGAKIDYVEPELKKFVEAIKAKQVEQRAEFEKQMKAQVEAMKASGKSDVSGPPVKPEKAEN